MLVVNNQQYLGVILAFHDTAWWRCDAGWRHHTSAAAAATSSTWRHRADRIRHGARCCRRVWQNSSRHVLHARQRRETGTVCSGRPTATSAPGQLLYVLRKQLLQVLWSLCCREAAALCALGELGARRKQLLQRVLLHVHHKSCSMCSKKASAPCAVLHVFLVISWCPVDSGNWDRSAGAVCGPVSSFCASRWTRRHGPGTSRRSWNDDEESSFRNWGSDETASSLDTIRSSFDQSRTQCLLAWSFSCLADDCHTHWRQQHRSAEVKTTKINVYGEMKQNIFWIADIQGAPKIIIP